MNIDSSLVKKLRERTGAGMMDCKEALKEASGNEDKAIEILRKKGAAKAEKKASRVALQGVVESYIHLGGKIGVLVEVNCETDFVAKNEDFKKFVKDIAMQIAAANPTYVKIEEVPQSAVTKEKEILLAQAREGAGKGKPEAVLEKIITGKLSKFYEEICLLEQPFIKDQTIKIKDCLTGLIGKIGENIVIKRFVRFQLGEE